MKNLINIMQNLFVQITINLDTKFDKIYFEGSLSGLKQFLATESPLKTMKNVFYFNLKAFFVLKIIKFSS